MTILSNLPEGVVYEILLRLPVTSIGRFKCVCKDWYKLIESIRFREDHFALQSNSALLLPHPDQFVGPERDFTWKSLSGESLTVAEDLDITVPVPQTLSNFNIICPCRGSFILYSKEDDYCALLGLWNPATRAFSSLLPTPRIEGHVPDDPCVYGLGWDPSSGGYKVVSVLYTRNAAMVYTPRTSNLWRFVDTHVPEVPTGTLLGWYPMRYSHANGFCYWQYVPRNLSRNSGNDYRKIVAFDMAQEVFATLSLPPISIHVNPQFTALSTYRDSLACLAIGNGCEVEVWDLEHQQLQQPSWTKVFNIKVRNICLKIDEFGIWNDTHIFVFGGTDSRKLLLCDMNRNHVEEREMDGNIDMTFFNYKTSLFSDSRRTENPSPVNLLITWIDYYMNALWRVF